MRIFICLAASLACAGALFAELPAPVSHWTFDDAEALGADAQEAHPLTALIASASYATPAGSGCRCPAAAWRFCSGRPVPRDCRRLLLKKGCRNAYEA